MIKPIRSSAIFLGISPAGAAPQKGPAGMDFYLAPSPLPEGVHGDLIRYRNKKVDIPDAPPFESWQVLYLSSDALGRPNAVTGTVLVPESWAGANVINYCVGTQGLAQNCAPSLQLQAGTCYENENFVAILNAGYAVVISDYPGYTTGDYPSYCNGINQGHAVLDILKAARQIPGGPSFTSNDQVVIWGFSQGGQSAPWAGQLQTSYMPDLNMVGVVAGGVPADLIAVGQNLDGGPGACFLLCFYAGLYYQYPDEVPLFDLVNEKGETAFNGAMDICLFDGLQQYMHVKTADFTKGGYSVNDLLKKFPKIFERVESLKLGSLPINAPVYMYHGTADPFIPMEQALELRDAYCKMGMDVTFQVFPTAEHLIPMFQATPYALDWIKERFDGVSVDKNNVCGSGPHPASDAQDTAEDFIIKMDNWHVDGAVYMKKLNQTIPVPDTAAMFCDANVSTRRVENGILDMPPFKARVRVVLPLKVGLMIEQVEPMNGSLDLDSFGIMTLHSVMRSTFSIKKFGAKLRTSSPVEMPVYFKGPVSAFGSGNLVFEGEAIIPKIKGVNLVGKLVAPVYSLLMSGPMSYQYRILPREPYLY